MMTVSLHDDGTDPTRFLTNPCQTLTFLWKGESFSFRSTIAKLSHFKQFYIVTVLPVCYPTGAFGFRSYPCFLSFSAYISPMPITIKLPDLQSQTAFNLTRWTEILADPELAKLPYRIETDQYGHILMSPPPAFSHGRRQSSISSLLSNLLPQGLTITECPVSTAGGVKAIDVAWLASTRPEILLDPPLLARAPDICVEILSPSNSAAEIDEKRALYFDAGAAEVWVCNLDASIAFFVNPDRQNSASAICPGFPTRIP
jgi:Uma2 family endonuclease